MPPAEETLDKADRVIRREHDCSVFAPASAAVVGASQSVTAAPPCTEIFFSLPSAKKPSHWPSGEKKGSLAFSVPESAVACNWSSERT